MLKAAPKYYFFSLFIVAFSLLPTALYCQITEPNTEQQIENFTESNDDNETEDDSYLQEMQEFIKHPININTANEDELNQLKIVSPQQIQNLLSYRRLFGNLLSIYELQAVPLWNLETIKKVKPFIVAKDERNATEIFSQRLSGGQHTILARVSQIIEKSKGYLTDTTSSFYPGSQQKLFLRYRYNYKNLLQYGFVGEKDAGEQFFKGNQKQGFDFYSAHLFIKNIGKIKSLALGDFTINMGQGLTQWQSLAFKKSADVTNIKRQASVLRPYNSAGEVFFHRGVGVTIQQKNIQATIFASYKNADANFVADTSLFNDDYVSSIQTSGFHRTKSEVVDKGVQKQLAYGGSISYNIKNIHIGINSIQYNFKLPLKKSTEPYNLYSLSGKAFGNNSIDYSYTYKNLHFFGEAAFTNNFNKAFINGLLVSASAIADISFVYRNLSPKYQSLNTNAFTESSTPTNEKGFFTGINLRPSNEITLTAYADFYKFPWLKYRVDAPTIGSDYLIQITYKPSKTIEIYSRFRSESKAINYNPSELTTNPIIPQPRQNWRTQLSYKINPSITLRNRLELVWFNNKAINKETGTLFYADLVYKPLLKPFSGNIRLQYFETDSYNSRLYAYENDVLYYYSVPLFYGKGFRYYANINYDFSKKLTAWLKWSQYLYKDKTLIGSGLDEIKGNHKSEIRFQLAYTF